MADGVTIQMKVYDATGKRIITQTAVLPEAADTLDAACWVRAMCIKLEAGAVLVANLTAKTKDKDHGPTEIRTLHLTNRGQTNGA
jgi:hypothetical protein